MSELLARARGQLLVWLVLLLVGCSPIVNSPREEDHPLILEAMARKDANPRDAARLLDKALEANPRLARAHWELGLICLNNISNYAAAVYHFQKVLEIRPDWPHATTAKQLINNAKIELVKEGVEAPTLPSFQRQMDLLVEELHQLTAAKTNLEVRVASLVVVTQQLTAENLQLRQQLLAFSTPNPSPRLLPGTADGRAGAASDPRPPAGQPPGREPLAESAGARMPRSAPEGNKAEPRFEKAAAVPAMPRTYTFKRGETAYSVTKRLGLTVRDLVEANPGLNPARIQSGQTVRLPPR